MGQSLEASIVVPIVVFLVIVIILSTTHIYENIYNESNIEQDVFENVFHDNRIWYKNNKVKENNYITTYIAVNPVKLKQLTDFMIDTTKEITDNIPLMDDAIGLMYE